jgi:hypothetical protein
MVLARSAKSASHLKRRHDLDGSLVFVRAVGDATAAKPALFRVLHDRRLALFRVGDESVAHTNIGALAASVTSVLVKVDELEGHGDYLSRLTSRLTKDSSGGGDEATLRACLTGCEWAGVKIAAGSDSPYSGGFTLLDELRAMVAHEMAPARALAAATVDGALCLGLEDETGSLAEGKLAGRNRKKRTPRRQGANERQSFFTANGKKSLVLYVSASLR